MNLNTNLLIQTSIAAILVIFGVVIKNSVEQLGFPNHRIGKPLGMGMFIIGWIYTAYILSINKPNKLLFILPSAGILISVLMMKQYMNKKESPPIIFPLLFSISWIILCFGVGNHLSGNKQFLGLFASLLVLLSMMKILPFQRKNNIVDGPGMPLFVIAWVIIIILNSNR
tara:strand:+ start:504 stop:1013 length:510 start_codon:yes stop_codon:yes gene_type:complete